MDKEKFKARTKAFALRVIRLVEALPKNQTTAQVIGKQLLRSGTSGGLQIGDWRFQIVHD